jgi:hypothetical protein
MLQKKSHPNLDKCNLYKHILACCLFKVNRFHSISDRLLLLIAAIQKMGWLTQGTGTLDFFLLEKYIKENELLESLLQLVYTQTFAVEQK